MWRNRGAKSPAVHAVKKRILLIASTHGAALRGRLPPALQDVRILARPCNGAQFLATVRALTGAA
jgi:hypothetical protein